MSFGTLLIAPPSAIEPLAGIVDRTAIGLAFIERTAQEHCIFFKFFIPFRLGAVPVFVSCGQRLAES